MADRIELNAGTGGAVLSTDEVTKDTVLQHVQYIKLMNGTADAIDVIPGDATNGLLVNLGANNDVTITGSVTVDGSGVTQPVSAASLPLPTGAATAANQTTMVGHLDGVEALLTTIDADTSNLSVVGGGTEAAAIRVTIASDSTGVLSIDDNGGAITVDGTVAVTNAGLTELAAAINGSSQMDVNIAASGATVPVSNAGLTELASAINASSQMDVNIAASNATVTVTGTVTANLAAGTNNIGDVDILSIAAGDNNIGNVDVVTLPNVTLAAGTNTNEVVGDIAHDTGVSGNPVQIAGGSQNMDDTAPPNRVSAESDVTRLATDWDGAIFAHPHGPQIWSYHVDGSSALTDTSVHAAPGAGLSLYVTDIVISSGAATAMNAFFEEGASKVLGPYYLEAIAGRGCAIHFTTPKKITANTALTVTTSAAIAHSIDVTGFTAPG